MKLIGETAALALVAGSADVEAQKEGKQNPPGGGTRRRSGEELEATPPL